MLFDPSSSHGVYTRIYWIPALLENDLKMSKSHVNVVSFDENVSPLSHLFKRNEHLLLETKQTSAQLTRSHETKELM